MSIEPFAQIYARAAERKGGENNLEALLDRPLPQSQLQQLGDDRYLSAFTKKVFQSGFVWRVVEQKWPAFEEIFFQFDIAKVLLMPDEMLEKKASNPDIIRNFTKVKSIRDNALMIDAICSQQGSFAEFVAQWPADNIIGLWDYLKKNGSRLGGNTGPYALRALGKDTFLLSKDVEGYFKVRELVTGSMTSKRSLNTVQETFNAWAEQSGRAMQEISKILSMSVGDNRIFVE